MMHAIVTPILKLAHNYRHDGREMTFILLTLGYVGGGDVGIIISHSLSSSTRAASDMVPVKGSSPVTHILTAVDPPRLFSRKLVIFTSVNDGLCALLRLGLLEIGDNTDFFVLFFGGAVCIVAASKKISTATRRDIEKKN